MQLTGIEAFAERMVEGTLWRRAPRVWLAELVAQNANWLLLDEPTSALNIAHKIEVLALDRKLSKMRGLGIIVVRRDLNMAARFCDYIVALHSGRVTSRGTPADTMVPQKLAEIFGIAMDVLGQPSTGPPITIARRDRQ